MIRFVIFLFWLYGFHENEPTDLRGLLYLTAVTLRFLDVQLYDNLTTSSFDIHWNLEQVTSYI